MKNYTYVFFTFFHFFWKPKKTWLFTFFCVFAHVFSNTAINEQRQWKGFNKAKSWEFRLKFSMSVHCMKWSITYRLEADTDQRKKWEYLYGCTNRLNIRERYKLSNLLGTDWKKIQTELIFFALKLYPAYRHNQWKI